MSNKGRYNRYLFLKKMNRKSIILIKGKSKYYSYGKDLEILKFINFNMEYINSRLSYLDKYNINYIVLDNLDIIDNVKFKNNNYMKYNPIIF